MQDKNDHPNGDAAATIDYLTRFTAPLALTLTPEKGREEQVLITRDAEGDTRITPASELFRPMAPEARLGTIEVHDLASFVSLVNRDKRADSVIFADVDARKLTAVLDYHGTLGASPRYCEDRVAYNFVLSEPLAAWVRAADRGMSQRDFARFIDDHLHEINAEPLPPEAIASRFAAARGISLAGPADLVTFTRTIATKSTTEAEEIVDENTGDVSISYKKKGDVKTPDGKPVAVPQAFAIRVPVLQGSDAGEYVIAVRLKYDITNSAITWTLTLNALERYVADAIEKAVAVVRLPADATPGGCGLPVFMGAPPA